MITIALLDDELTFLKSSDAILSSALLDLRTCDFEYKILTFQNSKDLLELTKTTFIDILVLDIHMPEPNGLSVAEHFHIESPDTKIIFLSNYEQYVFYSLRFAPFRFVRKSKIESELPEAVVSAISLLTSQNDFLDVSNPKSQQKVPFSKIVYIEKVKGKNYLEVHCTNELITFRQNISSIEKQLNKYTFTKINQSTLVNMRYIHQIKGDSLFLHSGDILKISRRSVDQVKDDYFGYMRNNSVN